MISHRKRFIFVHIPKTAGTSIGGVLSRHGVFLQGEHNYDSIYFKHAIASDLKRMMGDEFERYFKFTVVRNPWDWVASNYAFSRGLHRPFIRHTHYQVSPVVPDWAADWSFKQWLRWWIDTFSPQQSNMLTDETGRLLVDSVLRFEELNSEFSRLCLKLRIWPRYLPNMSKTKNRLAYTEYHDNETRQWVAKHFARDIDRFGYCFEGVRPDARPIT